MCHISATLQRLWAFEHSIFGMYTKCRQEPYGVGVYGVNLTDCVLY